MRDVYLTEFKELFVSLKPISKIYDDIRIVDPLAKKVYSFENDELVITNLICFDFWGRDESCANCISLRAIKENDTFVKIENNKKEAYMVTAIPFELRDRKVSIEILKNITNSLFFPDSTNTETIEIYSLINDINTLVMKDALTNIYNRRYIDERLPVDLINSDLRLEPMSVIMIDIDFFKNVNDDYGHIGGDFILKCFAKLLSTYVLEENGWVARYGGEEFIMCLNNIENNIAKEIAEQIRNEIEEEQFIYKDKIIKITASFGIATKKENCKTVEEIIELADKNLYLAKNSGRNRVI